MAVVKRLHVGEYGTLFLVTIKERDDDDQLQVVDVSTLVTGKVIFVKGDGSSDVITRPLVLQGDGTDGALTYTFVADDLDTEGRWTWQCEVVLDSGKWYTLKGFFYVDDSISYA